MWHAALNSLIRDQTWAHCIGSMKSQPLDHQGSPSRDSFYLNDLTLWEGIHLISKHLLSLLSYELLSSSLGSGPVSSSLIQDGIEASAAAFGLGSHIFGLPW